jgi:hypothetical protein
VGGLHLCGVADGEEGGQVILFVGPKKWRNFGVLQCLLTDTQN